MFSRVYSRPVILVDVEQKKLILINENRKKSEEAKSDLIVPFGVVPPTPLPLFLCLVVMSLYLELGWNR